MALNNLTEAEQDYSYSQGFLEEWLKGAPKQVIDHLNILVGGITAYREKYVTAQEMIVDLQTKYASLTAMTGQYVQHIQQQKEQIDQLLIESQKDIHQGKYIDTP